jgi:hypothetical protein
MQLALEAHVTVARNGVLARVPGIGLSGHGRDEQEALLSLERSLSAWSKALNRMGVLERHLNLKGIHYEAEGNSVTLQVTPCRPNLT